MSRVQQDLCGGLTFILEVAVQFNHEEIFMKVTEFEFMKFVTVATRESMNMITDFLRILAGWKLVGIFFVFALGWLVSPVNLIHDTFSIFVVEIHIRDSQIKSCAFRIGHNLVQVIFLRLFVNLPG